jgi:hypothetical protein
MVVASSAGAAAAAAVFCRCAAGNLRAAAALRFGGILGHGQLLGTLFVGTSSSERVALPGQQNSAFKLASTDVDGSGLRRSLAINTVSMV